MSNRLAIARNRTALLAVVATIVAMIGGRPLRQAQGEGGSIARSLRNAALALLRPAEAAARRLIVLCAHGVSALPRRAPVRIPGAAPADGACQALSPEVSWPQSSWPVDRGAARPPAFRLFDRRKRFGRMVVSPMPVGEPRIRSFWGASPSSITSPASVKLPAAPMPSAVVQARLDPDASVDATRLRLRTAALQRALSDLPHQARRLARWRARNCPGPGGRIQSPLRIGHPPGYRQHGTRDVDIVLGECHALALETLAQENWSREKLFREAGARASLVPNTC
jgi:hypothetical protein